MTPSPNAPRRPQSAPACPPDADGHCVTCSDEGIEMRVLEVGADGLGRCAGEGEGEGEVELTLVEPVAVGDRVLVHAGVAIARLE